MNIAVSFVIIEYKCIEEVFSCIESVKAACNNIKTEIIVSSNSGYPLDVQEELNNVDDETIWLFNAKNGGFAYGMNRGLSRASGDIVIVTNPDVQLSSQNLHSVLGYIKSNPSVGIIGPQIRDTNGNLQDTCRRFMGPIDLCKRMYKRLSKRMDVLLEAKQDYTKVQTVDWIIGAFMIIKRDALKKVGCLDENYFLYLEDMDWCKRFWDNGFQVVYYPHFSVIYKGDRKSTNGLKNGKLMNKYTFYHLRSYTHFLRKHGCWFKSKRSSWHHGTPLHDA